LSAGAPVPTQIRIEDETALIEVRRLVSEAAHGLGFGLVEHTKLITACSELTRNIIEHAGSGTVLIEILRESTRAGIRLTFSDSGPGIADVDLAMQEGYSSARGMGMGLPGAKRLTHQFSIESEPGRGTSIVIAMWKR
jgi:serine/threonine-protein kinase RsbT